jgi:hypothetical protein
MATFVPDVGVLVTRVLISQLSTELTICFRDDPNDEWHYRTICQIEDFSARCKTSGFNESSEAAASSFGGNTRIIHRHHSTRGELLIIPKLWNDVHVTLEEWLEEVVNLDRLRAAEKAYLRCIISAHLMAEA